MNDIVARKTYHRWCNVLTVSVANNYRTTRVVEVADKYGVAPAQISIAWLLSKPEIHAPIVGVSKIDQLEELIAAADITLDAEDVAYLEEQYRPLQNLLSIGFS